MAGQRGFTLLELLVVLALVALLAGVTVPRAMNWVEAARSRGQAAQVAAALESLPARAFFEGKALVLEANPVISPLPALPPGWRLETSAPLRYEANGMTSGGRVRLWEGQALRADWRVLPPSGEVRAHSGAESARQEDRR